ncbi:MAG: prolipoprotein diacylglyceryl transferase [Anaerolineae bacterium]|nr:prolipoprotein diacylglyceryl transferase [Anaerolineae bacterium]
MVRNETEFVHHEILGAALCRVASRTSLAGSPGMLPTLSFGPWQMDTYTVVVAIAVTTGAVYAFERLLQLDYPPPVIARGLILMSLGGVALTLVANEIVNRQRLARGALMFMPESRDIFWTLLGGGLVAVLYMRHYRAPVGQVLDLGVPALPLSQAIARLGCTAAGCCYGVPTNSWLGVYLPDDTGVWADRYPTQLLAAGANLLIFLILVTVERFIPPHPPPAEGGSEKAPPSGGGWRFPGFLSLFYIVLFSLKRFLLASMRQEGTIPLVGPLSWMHLNALVAGSAAGAVILWNFYCRRKETTA